MKIISKVWLLFSFMFATNYIDAAFIQHMFRTVKKSITKKLLPTEFARQYILLQYPFSHKNSAPSEKETNTIRNILKIYPEGEYSITDHLRRIGQQEVDNAVADVRYLSGLTSASFSTFLEEHTKTEESAVPLLACNHHTMHDFIVATVRAICRDMKYNEKITCYSDLCYPPDAWHVTPHTCHMAGSNYLFYSHLGIDRISPSALYVLAHTVSHVVCKHAALRTFCEKIINADNFKTDGSTKKALLKQLHHCLEFQADIYTATLGKKYLDGMCTYHKNAVQLLSNSWVLTKKTEETLSRQTPHCYSILYRKLLAEKIKHYYTIENELKKIL
ncbi:MAG TPA: hypothetical protein VEK38_00765 [Candidatus Bathyarchaeia archaeon]|nr:hypothetical protein [Candidatus Bathyarchaeia archaeon]